MVSYYFCTCKNDYFYKYKWLLIYKSSFNTNKKSGYYFYK